MKKYLLILSLALGFCTFGAEASQQACFDEILRKKPTSAQKIYNIVCNYLPGDSYQKNLVFIKGFYAEMYDELVEYDHLLSGVQSLIHENYKEIEGEDAGDYDLSKYKNGVYREEEDNSFY